jgi:outer membrane protein
MRMLWMATAVGGVLLVPVIWAQVGSPGTPAPAKIGTISLQAAIVNTTEGKGASNQLQSQFSARSTELQNMQKQIEDLQAKLKAGATLSDDQRETLERQGERLTRTLQRKQQYFQDDVNAAQQEVMNNIRRKLAGVVSKYSKEHSYSVILDTSSQQTNVVYGAPEVDVTQEITRLYDQTYPMKTAVTPQPAAKP